MYTLGCDNLTNLLTNCEILAPVQDTNVLGFTNRLAQVTSLEEAKYILREKTGHKGWCSPKELLKA